MPDFATTPVNEPVTHPLEVADDAIVGVTLWMPARLATAFQPRALHLLEELTGVAPDPGTYRAPHSRSYGPTDAWKLQAWQDPDDDAAARWILGDLRPKQRKVLALLAAAGTDGVWTNDLRLASGYGNDAGMSGVFKAIGGRFRRCGLRPLWNGGEKRSGDGQLLSVQEPAALAVFVRALCQDHEELAAEVGLI